MAAPSARVSTALQLFVVWTVALPRSSEGTIGAPFGVSRVSNAGLDRGAECRTSQRCGIAAEQEDAALASMASIDFEALSPAIKELYEVSRRPLGPACSASGHHSRLLAFAEGATTCFVAGFC